MVDIEALIPKLRGLGSDGTFDGDLKVLMGCKIVFAGMKTVDDLKELQKEIVALHQWHLPVKADIIGAIRVERHYELQSGQRTHPYNVVT